MADRTARRHAPRPSQMLTDNGDSGSGSGIGIGSGSGSGNRNGNGNGTVQTLNRAVAVTAPPTTATVSYRCGLRRGWRCIIFLLMAAVFIVSAILGNYRARGGINRNVWTKGTKSSIVEATENFSQESLSLRHPRVACLTGFDDTSSRYDSLAASFVRAFTEHTLDAIPRKATPKSSKLGRSSGDSTDVFAEETKECKLADPSYQAEPAAPATCNDVHALGFHFGPRTNGKEKGKKEAYFPQHTIKYLTSGGFRSVWTVTRLYQEDEEVGEEEGWGDPRVVMKTNQLNRGWTPHYLDQNRKDILVSERSGGPPSRSNVLQVYHYCAFSSIVPFATAGVLDSYVRDRLAAGAPLSAEEDLDLALQAARGLYQSQLYSDGKATHVHADVKPPQFLLFDQPTPSAEGPQESRRSAPFMQINDFNRGQFLTRSKDNDTCPFRMCSVHHKGSLYRSPEEYMDCADQSDRIDVFALGGVFYYLLSDGEKPWYYIRSYKEGVERWLSGEKPRLPRASDYRQCGERVMATVKERSRHPAFLAVKEVMTNCWALKPEDRPSSLQVVQMLEEKWHEMNPSARQQTAPWPKDSN